MQVMIAILEYCFILWLIRFQPEHTKQMIFKYFKKSVVSPSEERKQGVEKQRYVPPVGEKLDLDLELKMMQKAKTIDRHVLISMPVLFAIVFIAYFLYGFYG